MYPLCEINHIRLLFGHGYRSAVVEVASLDITPIWSFVVTARLQLHRAFHLLLHRFLVITFLDELNAVSY